MNDKKIGCVKEAIQTGMSNSWQYLGLFKHCRRPLGVLLQHCNGAYSNVPFQPLDELGKSEARFSFTGESEHLKCLGILVYLLISLVFAFF